MRPEAGKCDVMRISLGDRMLRKYGGDASSGKYDVTQVTEA